MFRRSVRIACLVVGLLATAGLTYRALQDEDALNRERQSAAARAMAVARAAELLLDLRASMHAYVAPGQGLPFWGKRAQETIDQLRQSLVELDGQLAPSGGSLTESLEAVDELTAAERRARTHVSRGEMQLAGDVIFTEVRDLVGSAAAELESIRGSVARADERRAVAIRQQQVMFAGAALAVWIAIALLLMPTEPKASVKDPAEWRNELKEKIKKPIPVAPDPVVEQPAPVVPVAALEPATPETLEALKQVSEICSDLSALADPGALEGALARVNTVLNATGLIVWIASNDGGTLSPVATHGFDPKLVARIGRINRDGANLTATAFRENGARISAATATAPAALAVPMYSPNGPSGVLSVELKNGQSADDAKVAVSAIIAAQLATLAMPIPDAPAETIEEPRRAAL
jgi:hypothetical protein